MARQDAGQRTHPLTKGAYLTVGLWDQNSAGHGLRTFVGHRGWHVCPRPGFGRDLRP